MGNRADDRPSRDHAAPAAGSQPYPPLWIITNRRNSPRARDLWRWRDRAGTRRTPRKTEVSERVRRVRGPVMNMTGTEGFLGVMPLAPILLQRVYPAILAARMKYTQWESASYRIAPVLQRRSRYKNRIKPTRLHRLNPRPTTTRPLLHLRIVRDVIDAVAPATVPPTGFNLVHEIIQATTRRG